MEKIEGAVMLTELNALDTDVFEWLFENVIEQCPEATQQVALKRPFPSVAVLKGYYDEYLNNLDERGKKKIIKKHPELSNTKEVQDKLSSESRIEQESAGIHTMIEDESERLKELNEQYKEKFGFPFVICTRDNTLSDIFNAMEARIHNTVETELDMAIEEVRKICKYRINALVWSPE